MMGIDFRIPTKWYVVDNNSTPEYREKLTDHLEVLSGQQPIDWEIIEQDCNTLFSRATNVGTKKALEEGAVFITYLNPDISFTSETWSYTENPFEVAVEKMNSNRNHHIVGFKLLMPNGNIEHAGGRDNAHIGYNTSNEFFKAIEEVEWVTGACTLIKREVFEKIGFLDEVRYPHWVSDHEFCRRAKLHGFNTYYYPIELIHGQGKSTPQSSHVECDIDNPAGVVANKIPVSLESIKLAAEENAKIIPICST
jgi:GT2 family glycosyltransferase